jgi:hypothetical protein
MGHSPYEAATFQIIWGGIEQVYRLGRRRGDPRDTHLTRLPLSRLSGVELNRFEADEEVLGALAEAPYTFD